MFMHNLLQKLMLGGSAASLIATCAYGQDATNTAPAQTPETVIVSGTLITIQGYQAPTPVTVVGTEQLLRDSKTDIGDEIRELPAVGASASPSNGIGANDAAQGDSGLDAINLRNLGANRTLILFDGQRVVSSNLFGGGVDLSTIPTGLVQRIDVVTGGASATYGSDAVAGVVNLILNKSFTGLKGDFQAGDTTTFQHRQMKSEVSWGTDFAAGKGHLILSGSYTMSPDSVFAGMEPYNQGEAIVQNPAATSSNGLPIYIHVLNSGNDQYTTGGLISANTAGGAGSTLKANALKGTAFGPGGSLEVFNYGTVFGSTCYNGCTNNQFNSSAAYGLLAVPYHQGTIFAYASYKLTPDIQASIQLNYGTNSEKNTATLQVKSFTIYADNPYLPVSIASQFGTLTYPTGPTNHPAQSITLGTNNLNNSGFGSAGFSNRTENYRSLCLTIGQVCDTDSRQMMRGVFTLEGAISDDWSWNAYVQHSEVRERQIVANDPLNANLGFATDAVIVTSANVGTSGLPIGSIQCRALLQGNAAAAGCAPLDVIGEGVASRAAWQYINPGETPTGRLNQELIILNQDVLHASMQGVLPWALPAGKVAVAFGGEYRHEEGGIIASRTDNGGATTAWGAGNFVPYQGQYNVKEGFLEVDAPLLKDQYVQSLNLNAAGRFTDYSTSGAVQTWKLGLTSQVNDDVRLRTTWSLDIRAPIISELFAPGAPASQQCVYQAGTPAYPCYQLQAGNPKLQPEKAVTVSGGVVLTPHWVDGLSVSADWYSINLHGGIYSTPFQTVINRCVANNDPVYCSALSQPNAAGQPTLVFVGPLNAASISTSGLDFQGNYRTDLFDGELNWNVTGSMTSQYNQTALGINYDEAGATGTNSYLGTGLPKWRTNISATYNEGPWSATVQGRLLGAMRYTNGQEGISALSLASISSTGALIAGNVSNPNQFDTNSIHPVGYIDVRGSYRFNDNIVLYAAIDNVTNVPPPYTGGFGGAAVYDYLGRNIRAGIRFSY
jgi:outer membrane receptor protein involved in Fe transport